MALHLSMSTPIDNLESAADLDARAVTVTVARRVAPGRERDFERWVDGLLHVAESYPGFLGGGILRPPASGQDWHVVYRFTSNDALREWEASPVRAEWLRRADDVMSETGVTRTSGLETWFSLPGRTAPAPPRWKMALVTVVAVLPLALLFNLLVAPLVEAWPLVARVGLLSVLLVTVMTWVVMPRLTRLLSGWLYPDPAAGASHEVGAR